MTAIIDYGVGNLFSLVSSFRKIGEEAVITADKTVIENADRVILPGVGAFRDAVDKLQKSGLKSVLFEQIERGKPVMGICLGMQLLFNKSYEYGEYEGLGLIDGEIRPIADDVTNLKVPHMGWNALNIKNPVHPLFKYVKNGEHVYFVHSFYGVKCESSTVATAEYGVSITAAVGKDNLMGCQFHPEKSGETGLNILRAFCEMKEGKIC